MCFLIPSQGAMELGSNEANTTAYGTGGLTRGTFHVTNHLSIHMGVYHAIPNIVRGICDRTGDARSCRDS
eukprot:4536353-Pyramimonas_sp.AAC.1